MPIQGCRYPEEDGLPIGCNVFATSLFNSPLGQAIHHFIPWASTVGFYMFVVSCARSDRLQQVDKLSPFFQLVVVASNLEKTCCTMT